MKDKNDSFRVKIEENISADYQERAKVPNSVLIELSNACNHSCLFCSHRKMTRPVKRMEYNFACRILKEAHDLGARKVGLFMGGEPLIYKRLEDVIRFCKDTGYEYVYITTNGVLADLDRMKKFIDAGLDSVKFSINAVDRKSYKLVHGRDDFETVMNNIKALYHFRDESKGSFNIYISSITTRYNDSNERIDKELSGYCDSLAIYQAGNADGLVPEVDNYLRKEDEVFEVSNQRTLPCFLPFNCFHITCEGYLTACCLDLFNNLAYADLHKISLMEAWNCECIRKFRRNHLDKKVEGTLCYNCVHNTREKVYPLNELLGEEISYEVLHDYSQLEKRIREYEEEVQV